MKPQQCFPCAAHYLSTVGARSDYQRGLSATASPIRIGQFIEENSTLELTERHITKRIIST